MAIPTQSQSSKYDKANAGLRALLELNTNGLGKASNLTLRERWRLLPSGVLYLTASHYYTDDNWCVSHKWDLFKCLDKALKNCNSQGALVPINQAINAAIVDQRRIVLLAKAFDTLSSQRTSPEEKSKAYAQIQTEDAVLFGHLKSCIWFTHDKPENMENFVGRLIAQEPSGKFQLETIRKMIQLLKEGYSNCQKYPAFFEGAKEAFWPGASQGAGDTGGLF